MELKQIKELMAAMKKEGIKKCAIKEKSGFEIALEREEASASSPAPAPSPPFLHHYYHPPFAAHPPRHDELHGRPFPHAAELAPQSEGEAKKAEEGRYITSPLVGMLYTAPSPDDPPFIKVGDRVEEGTVVCIVEAMKVMNEVKAGISGVVAEILLRNADPVEFGTKLFRVT